MADNSPVNEYTGIIKGVFAASNKAARYEQVVKTDDDANNGIIKSDSNSVKAALNDITERLKILSDGLIGIETENITEHTSTNAFIETDDETSTAARFKLFKSGFTIPNTDAEIVFYAQKTENSIVYRTVKIRTTGKAILSNTRQAISTSTTISGAGANKISDGSEPTMHLARDSSGNLLWALTGSDSESFHGHAVLAPKYVLKLDYGELPTPPDLGFSPPPRQPPQGRGSIQPPSQPDPQPDEDDDQMHGP